MGADLCAYIVFGPANLSSHWRTRAKAKKVINDFISALVEYDEDDIGWTKGYKDNPDKLIDELFEVWDGSMGRDTNMRYCPFDDKKKVVVAGDMSWGDEPDGFGYQTLKRAEMAGLFDVYKLE